MTTTTAISVTLEEVRSNLHALVQRALQGEDIIIVDAAGNPLVRLAAVMAGEQPHIPGLNADVSQEAPPITGEESEVAAQPPRIFGLHAGQIWMSDDFDAELPDEFWFGEE